MKKIKFVLVAALFVISGGLAAVYFGLLSGEHHIKTTHNFEDATRFKQIVLDFSHRPHKDRFPFMGGTVLDIDNDGKMEIFISGSKGQSNGVFSFRDGGLVDITAQTGLTSDEASFGATSIDMDNDGDTDLIVAQHDGVWVYTNTNGKFTGAKLRFTPPENALPLNVAVTDLNGDGKPDLYVSHFVVPEHFDSAVFNQPDHAKSNTMLLNKGDGDFEDVTQQTGTGGIQNTFHSTFVDLDGDGHQDLVLANNTGPIQMFRNLGNLQFEEVGIISGLGFWMGLGVGDIDNDGDQDLYFSNIGSSIPAFLLRGDLEDDQDAELDWLLLRNDGNWKFTDITKDYGLGGFGFAWGGVFEDLNLDGLTDLLVAQNYIKWPLHRIHKLKNKAFLQVAEKDESQFHHTDQLGLNNPYYGQAPLIVDLDNNGKPDVVWLNMGGPARAFLNTSKNRSLKVMVPDTAEFLGAQVVLKLKNGNSLTRQVVANTGMASDQTPNLFFGLGKEQVVQSVQITKPDGSYRMINNLPADNIIRLN